MARAQEVLVRVPERERARERCRSVLPETRAEPKAGRARARAAWNPGGLPMPKTRARKLTLPRAARLRTRGDRAELALEPGEREREHLVRNQPRSDGSLTSAYGTSRPAPTPSARPAEREEASFAPDAGGWGARERTGV